MDRNAAESLPPPTASDSNTSLPRRVRRSKHTSMVQKEVFSHSKQLITQHSIFDLIAINLQSYLSNTGNSDFAILAVFERADRHCPNSRIRYNQSLPNITCLIPLFSNNPTLIININHGQYIENSWLFAPKLTRESPREAKSA